MNRIIISLFFDIKYKFDIIKGNPPLSISVPLPTTALYRHNRICGRKFTHFAEK
jgi:hypothetical protein